MQPGRAKRATHPQTGQCCNVGTNNPLPRILKALLQNFDPDVPIDVVIASGLIEESRATINEDCPHHNHSAENALNKIGRLAYPLDHGITQEATHRLCLIVVFKSKL